MFYLPSKIHGYFLAEVVPNLPQGLEFGEFGPCILQLLPRIVKLRKGIHQQVGVDVCGCGRGIVAKYKNDGEEEEQVGEEEQDKKGPGR